MKSNNFWFSVFLLANCTNVIHVSWNTCARIIDVAWAKLVSLKTREKSSEVSGSHDAKDISLNNSNNFWQNQKHVRISYLRLHSIIHHRFRDKHCVTADGTRIPDPDSDAIAHVHVHLYTCASYTVVFRVIIDDAYRSAARDSSLPLPSPPPPPPTELSLRN